MVGPTVAVFVGSWLAYSETFIYDQLVGHQRYAPHACAYGYSPHAELFPFSAKTVLSAPEKWTWRVLQVAPTFERTFSRRAPCVAHAHFGTNASIAVPMLERRGIPLVTTFHAHDVAALLPGATDEPRYRLYRRRAPRLFRYSHWNLPSSLELADVLVKDLAVPAERVQLHRIGIDLDKFAYCPPRERPIRILMVGRFVEKKGFEYGIQAFARVAPLLDGATLSLVGEGDREETYREIARREGVEERVFFLGRKSSQEVAALLRDTDVFLAPSVTAENGDREGGLTVVKEASACGLGIVASAHGGIVDIVEHERTGLLAPERDVSCLAAYLLRMGRNFAERADFGRSARAKVEREYNNSLQMRVLEEIYDDAVHRAS